VPDLARLSRDIFRTLRGFLQFHAPVSGRTFGLRTPQRVATRVVTYDDIETSV